MAAPYRRVCRVLKPHGTHGEVSIALVEGLPEHSLEELAVWVVPPPASGVRALQISSVRSGSKGPIVTFQDLDSAADVGPFAGRWLLARNVDLPVVPPTRDDLIGMVVSDSTRGVLGTVSDVIVTGANDVLVIDGEPFGQVLVPDIPQVVRAVDVARRTIDVELLDGLIEDDR